MSSADVSPPGGAHVSTGDSTTPLDQQLCFAVYAANNAMMRAYRPLLDELNLTYTQYLVMLALWHGGTSTTTELAASLEVQPHALTPVVDRLVAGGLVERRRDTADRRRTMVTVTPAGRELESRVADVQREIACLAGADEPAMTILRETLRELADRLNS